MRLCTWTQHSSVVSLISLLFLLTAGIPRADTVIPLGDWVYMQSDAYRYARTRNIHNLEFGIICRNKCQFVITPALVCETKKQVSGWMIQQNGVSKKIETVCIEQEGGNALLLKNYDEILSSVNSNSELHFLLNFDVRNNSLMSFNLLGWNDVRKMLKI